MLISMHHHPQDGELKVDFTPMDHNGPLATVTLREPSGQQFEFYGRDRATLMRIADAFKRAAESVPELANVEVT